MKLIILSVAIIMMGLITSCVSLKVCSECGYTAGGHPTIREHKLNACPRCKVGSLREKRYPSK